MISFSRWFIQQMIPDIKFEKISYSLRKFWVDYFNGLMQGQKDYWHLKYNELKH